MQSVQKRSVQNQVARNSVNIELIWNKSKNPSAAIKSTTRVSVKGDLGKSICTSRSVNESSEAKLLSASNADIEFNRCVTNDSHSSFVTGVDKSPAVNRFTWVSVQNYCKYKVNPQGVDSACLDNTIDIMSDSECLDNNMAKNNLANVENNVMEKGVQQY